MKPVEIFVANPTDNVPVRLTGQPAGQPAIIVNCRPVLDRLVDRQNLQNLDQILLTYAKHEIQQHTL